MSNWLWVVLTVLCLHVIVLHQWRYREQYERAKDKFTSILETPEYEAHKRSKKISDVSYGPSSQKVPKNYYYLFWCLLKCSWLCDDDIP